MAREFDPIKGMFPDKNTILCKDCRWRDKTTLTINGKEYTPGVTRAFCEKYPAPPASEGKPDTILFQHGDCAYYELEV